jgi:transketolase
MPSWELFEAQDEQTRAGVLGDPRIPRVAIEAGVSMGWHKWVGEHGLVVGIDRFGASAPGERVLDEYGLSPQKVAARLREHIASLR